jgi:hypothetical protein
MFLHDQDKQIVTELDVCTAQSRVKHTWKQRANVLFPPWIHSYASLKIHNFSKQALECKLTSKLDIKAPQKLSYLHFCTGK